MVLIMRKRPEFTGQANPVQHLIDLGLPSNFATGVQTVLQEATTFGGMGKVQIEKKLLVGLGGPQVTSPVVRLLYADDPKVRELFQKELGHFGLPLEVMDTYFDSEQEGFWDVLDKHPKVDQAVLREFVPVAQAVAFNFLRSYFGFPTGQVKF